MWADESVTKGSFRNATAPKKQDGWGMYHFITEIQNMLHKFVPIESSSGWSNFLRHQWLMSKCFLKRNIAMRTWRSKAFQWGKCGLSSEMQPKCGPFHHFGPRADQVCNCGPLRKHCIIQGSALMNLMLRRDLRIRGLHRELRSCISWQRGKPDWRLCVHS